MKEFNEKLKKWDPKYHQFMDVELLRGIVEEFNWTSKPVFLNELPDGVIIKVHEFSFFFSENFMDSGEISVDIKIQGSDSFDSFFNILDRMKKEKNYGDYPVLKPITPVHNSIDKVSDRIRNKLILIRHYFPILSAGAGL